MLSELSRNNSIVNWASLVRDMLCNNGFGNIWEAQSVLNENLLCLQFKQRLADIYFQTWQTKINNSRKTLMYKHIVNTFEPREYLSIVKNDTYRIALVRFRTRNHRLAVEAGSWRKPVAVPFNERICFHCTDGKLEDEYHFLLECPHTMILDVNMCQNIIEPDPTC